MLNCLLLVAIQDLQKSTDVRSLRRSCSRLIRWAVLRILAGMKLNFAGLRWMLDVFPTKFDDSSTFISSSGTPNMRSEVVSPANDSAGSLDDEGISDEEV